MFKKFRSIHFQVKACQFKSSPLLVKKLLDTRKPASRVFLAPPEGLMKEVVWLALLAWSHASHGARIENERHKPFKRRYSYAG